MTNWRWLWVLLALEVLLTGIDVWVGPGARLATEEAWNVRAGLQLACGHGEHLWALQYRSFCGGCTAESVAAAALFRGLGESLWTWKLVPAGLHLAVVGLGAALAGRAWGVRSAAFFVALMAAAPPFYRELALTGYGNHVEGTAFVLGSAVLWVHGMDQPWLRRVPLLLGAGAVAGLGVWFAWSTVYGVAALAVLGLVAWRRGGLIWVLGLPAGLWPWRALTAADSGAAPYAQDWWTTIQLAPVHEWWRWLAGDFGTGGLLAQARGLPSLAWWLVIWALGLAGVLAVLRNRSLARFWGPAALGALLVAWVLRYDAWSDTYPLDTYSPFLLRYRSPLVPLLALLAAGAGVQWPRWRPVLLGVCLVGLAVRPLAWSSDPGPALAPAYAPVVGPPDPTVPTGRPVLRHAHGLHRPQDVQAALDYLANHQDPLRSCRMDHINTLGLRLGALLSKQPDHVLKRTAFQALKNPQERAHLQAVLDEAAVR
jgi:hypothetical protein